MKSRGGLEGELDVLLDEQHGTPGLPSDLGHQLEELET
jgi:hypothetical protein